MENKIAHMQARHSLSMTELFLHGQEAAYLKIAVKRDRLVRDAILQLSLVANHEPERLTRPLRVEFLGEEGIDEGGVQKEFFQLLLEHLFDPEYAMFTLHSTTNLYWFSQVALDGAQNEFKLLGQILGVALYNNVILDLHFPMAVYKKVSLDVWMFGCLDARRRGGLG